MYFISRKHKICHSERSEESGARRIGSGPAARWPRARRRPGQQPQIAGLSQSRDLVTLSAAKSPSPNVGVGFFTAFRMTISAPPGGRADFATAVPQIAPLGTQGARPSGFFAEFTLERSEGLRITSFLPSSLIFIADHDRCARCKGKTGGLLYCRLVASRRLHSMTRGWGSGVGGQRRRRRRGPPIQNPKSKIQNPKSEREELKVDYA